MILAHGGSVILPARESYARSSLCLPMPPDAGPYHPTRYDYDFLYFTLQPYGLVVVLATVEPFSSAVTASST